MRRQLSVLIMVVTATALIIGLLGAGTAAAYKAKKPTDGCTPGYWKQPQHFDSWQDFDPDQLFADAYAHDTDAGVDVYFEDAFPGMTLLEVLSQGGGGLNALGRHAVAALLNGSSSDVAFYWSSIEVIKAFNSVHPGGNYNGLKNMLEAQNELGCPLS